MIENRFIFQAVLLVLLMSYTIAYSQTDMKKKTFKDIDYFELSDKERVKIMDEHKQIDTKGYKGDLIHKLANGQVIFEMKGITSFLFESEERFKKYIEITEQPQATDEELRTYSHPISDSSFIEKKDMYVSFFLGQNELELDLNIIDELKKLDEVLNKMSNEDVKKYRLSLVAIIGEFISLNIEGAEWKYLNVTNSERHPVILVKDKELVNPATIFYDEYNRKVSNPAYQININKAVKEFLIRHN